MRALEQAQDCDHALALEASSELVNRVERVAGRCGYEEYPGLLVVGEAQPPSVELFVESDEVTSASEAKDLSHSFSFSRN